MATHYEDMLEAVVLALQTRKGSLPAVEKSSGIPLDTIHRIKNRENDPGYSKVRRLAAVLGVRVRATIKK